MVHFKSRNQLHQGPARFEMCFTPNRRHHRQKPTFTFKRTVSKQLLLLVVAHRFIVTSSLVSCDINDFVHVARPWSSAEAPTSPV